MLWQIFHAFQNENDQLNRPYFVLYVVLLWHAEPDFYFASSQKQQPVGMTSHSDILFWLRAIQSSLYPFNTTCLANKRLPGAWITHLVKVCLSKTMNLTKSYPTILTQGDLSRTIIRIISVIESFFLSIIVFKILAENCKKKKNVIFHLSRAITLTRSCLTTFIPEDFWRPYNKGHFEIILLNLTVLEI